MIDLLISYLVLQLILTADMRLYSGDHEALVCEAHRHALGSSIYHVTSGLQDNGR